MWVGDGYGNGCFLYFFCVLFCFQKGKDLGHVTKGCKIYWPEISPAKAAINEPLGHRETRCVCVISIECISRPGSV